MSLGAHLQEKKKKHEHLSERVEQEQHGEPGHQQKQHNDTHILSIAQSAGNRSRHWDGTAPFE